MKICPVVAELFQADRRTDTTMLLVASRNFANAHKKDFDGTSIVNTHCDVKIGS